MRAAGPACFAAWQEHFYFSNHMAAGLVLLAAAFFILFSASTWAGLITPNFVLGFYWFRPVQ
jgi:diacylglycerol kinase